MHTYSLYYVAVHLRAQYTDYTYHALTTRLLALPLVVHEMPVARVQLAGLEAALLGREGRGAYIR